MKDNQISVINEDTYIIVDIETTGFSVEHCYILEVACLKIEMGDIIGNYHSFIKCHEPIPAFIKNLTGITDEDVAGGKELATVMCEFKLFTGNLPIVGHNVSFDFRFLNYNHFNCFGEYLTNATIDTVRIAKELICDIPNYKLDTLVNYFGISSKGHHRADYDVNMTYLLIKHLSDIDNYYLEKYSDQIVNSCEQIEEFRNKKIAIKSTLKYVNSRLLERILNDAGCKVYYALYSSCNIVIMSDKTYERYLSSEVFDDFYESWLNKTKRREEEGSIKVIPEKRLCEIIGLPIVEKKKSNSRISAKDIVTETEEFDENHPLYQKYIVFTGALDKIDRKTAMQRVVNVGGICQNGITNATNYLILGDNSFCSSIKDGKSSKQKRSEDMIEKGFDIKVIPETTFYQLLKNEEE